MPAVPPGSKILLTGANGFAAVWIVRELLDNGFSVCGTVRSEVAAAYLRGLFKDFGARFKTAIVEDITKEGAFDSLVQGVDAVIHTAGPVNSTAVEPDEVIKPTVDGVQSILRSALMARSTLKRVVLMSSSSAVFMPASYDDPKMHEVWDDNTWSNNTVEAVRTLGRDAMGPYKYAAAKVLAERGAWELVQREKAKEGGLEWDFVTLCPSYVFGPPAHDVPALEKLKGSSKDFYDHVVKVDIQGPTLTSFGYAWIDVRDVARAFALALTVPEAAGERFNVSAGPFVWQQFVDFVHKQYPKEVPAGEPSYKLEESVYFAKFNAEKSQKILGLKYRSMEETAKDTAAEFKNRGWL
ncbi:NAD(P)-binding protein [Lentinus brumalis]|uniref:NAD(P)-binding protein n=1 Tax=Lentinus brumalis TaxID=2498619 RepID=A0A371D2B3_9APHY|nr:NAD(P)-binding protein [Polyporus brumalis]